MRSIHSAHISACGRSAHRRDRQKDAQAPAAGISDLFLQDESRFRAARKGEHGKRRAGGKRGCARGTKGEKDDPGT